MTRRESLNGAIHQAEPGEKAWELAGSLVGCRSSQPDSNFLKPRIILAEVRIWAARKSNFAAEQGNGYL